MDHRAVLRLRPVVRGPEMSVAGSGSGGLTFDATAPPVSQEQIEPAYAQLDCAAVEDGADLTRPEDYAALCSADDTTRYLLGPEILDGSQVTDAAARADDATGDWVVDLEFAADARTAWADYTAAHVGESVAFTVDGQVISAPTIQGAITGTTTITGQFTEKTANQLAAQLTGE